MSIETFYTAQSSSQNSATGGRMQASASASSKGGASGTLASSELGFFDMFLQTAAMALEAQKNKAQQKTVTGEQKSIMDTPLEDIPADSRWPNLSRHFPLAKAWKKNWPN